MSGSRSGSKRIQIDDQTPAGIYPNPNANPNSNPPTTWVLTLTDPRVSFY